MDSVLYFFMNDVKKKKKKQKYYEHIWVITCKILKIIKNKICFKGLNHFESI